jgi:hypothetical protein
MDRLPLIRLFFVIFLIACEQSNRPQVRASAGGVSGSWMLTGPMTTDRRSARGVRLLDGRVLVTSSGTAELYDPTTDTWRATGQPQFGVIQDLVLLQDGQVLGLDTGVAFLYSPTMETWRTVEQRDVLGNRLSPSVSLLNDGRVLIAGGSYPSFTTNFASLFDPSTETFSATGSMSVSRSDHTGTILLDGTVLVAGGYAFAGMASATRDSAEIYDPGTSTFTLIESRLSEPRSAHSATLLQDGRVLITGGINLSILSSVEIFNPGTLTFTLTGSLSTPRFATSANLLPCGVVLVAGGIIIAGFPPTSSATAELYAPDSGIWSPAASMSTSRSFHAAALLLDGQVLVAGGTTEPTAERFSGACAPCSSP